MKTKIDKAIKLIQKAESLALEYKDYGFILAFSGGKTVRLFMSFVKWQKLNLDL